MVEDLVRLVGFATLKLVTLGSYQTDEAGDSLLLEGLIGLFIAAGFFFLLYVLTV
jgi:hypothetical protein